MTSHEVIEVDTSISKQYRIKCFIFLNVNDIAYANLYFCLNKFIQNFAFYTKFVLYCVLSTFNHYTSKLKLSGIIILLPLEDNLKNSSILPMEMTIIVLINNRK